MVYKQKTYQYFSMGYYIELIRKYKVFSRKDLINDQVTLNMRKYSIMDYFTGIGNLYSPFLEQTPCSYTSDEKS